MEKNHEKFIQIQGITKKYSGSRKEALSHITATLRSGLITGLVGPDGAGKTTLIRLIAGLLRPTTGYIRVLGLDTLKDSNALHNVIGYMPQKFGLYEDLTVIENLNLYANLHGLKGEEKEHALSDMLEFTSLSPFLHRPSGRLSGGMKQKLGLACALLSRPKILLLDEPSVGVDPISRRDLWTMVEGLSHQGIGILWSTSYLDEADKCQKVILLNEGHLLYIGSPNTLAKTLEGRVFETTSPLQTPRKNLKTLLNDPSVIDGLIQGKKIRIVCAPTYKPSSALTNWQPVKPRFEDAFVDILGEESRGDSVLAKALPLKRESSKVPIEAKNLTKRFGNFTAARQISFQIKRGEIFGLLGPNGAGKSTIFKMLCGLLTPTEGQALVSGFNLQTAPSLARARIGYMAQKFSLYGTLSARENLNFFSGVYGLSRKKRQEKIALMSQIFNLEPYLQMDAETLPLGYKQRLALACAVMHEPDVLFLDEPTSGVDPTTRREFWTHINGMVEKGVTIMVTTHFMEEAEYCDRISLIYQGTSIATGTPDNLKARVQTKERPNPTLEDSFIALIEQTHLTTQESRMS